jgi:outer membrane protein TolC
LRAAQVNLRAGYGVFFPAVGASFEATRQRYSPSRLVTCPPMIPQS